jgi:hypothetical protein
LFEIEETAMSAKMSAWIVALSLLSVAQADGIEVFNLRGDWYEKCPTFNIDTPPNMEDRYRQIEDPWTIDSSMSTPMPEGNMIKGIGELGISQYETGCTLTRPKLDRGNKIRFHAVCGSEEGNKPAMRTGVLEFQFLDSKKMKVTWPIPIVSEVTNKPTRTMVLYRCED